jgi:hypothetical protein
LVASMGLRSKQNGCRWNSGTCCHDALVSGAMYRVDAAGFHQICLWSSLAFDPKRQTRSSSPINSTKSHLNREIGFSMRLKSTFWPLQSWICILCTTAVTLYQDIRIGIPTSILFVFWLPMLIGSIIRCILRAGH